MNNEKRTIASNFFSLTVLQAVNYLLPILVLPFLVRVLGLDKFGLVMFAQSLAAFFIIAVDFGFEISGTREIALAKKNKENLSQIFSAILIIKLALIIFWFITLFLLVEFIPRFKNNSIVYYLSFGIVIGHAIFPVWFFQGIEKMKFVTFINILAKLIFTVLLFIVIREESDYYLVPAFNSIGFILAGILGLLLCLKYVRFVKPPINLIKRLFIDSISLFFGKFATNLYTTCNVLILGFFVSDAIVGVYSSMEKLIIAVKNIYSPFYQASFPWLSNQSQNNRIKFLKKVTPIVFSIGLVIALVIYGFGDIILELIYDDELVNQYVLVFKILGVIAIFASLNMMLVSLYFTAVKLYKSRMQILIITGLFHLPLSLILVKLYGIYGMATAVMITEFFLLVIAFYFFQKHISEKLLID
ncbi:oligosaccharide flippase family protein [Winogradskyella sp. R77965]|uniref:oligosaccharide flippase family protein n=1 Tax=Winogradskyella sp. R77965 TaxID=3093872 RepID=UPI0037DC2104